MELGEAELSAYTQGVTLLVQGQLDLREDLAPEVLREKVRLLYNCGQVILNTEQQAALLPVTINQGHLSLRKAETEKTQPQANPDECVLGDMSIWSCEGEQRKNNFAPATVIDIFPLRWYDELQKRHDGEKRAANSLQRVRGWCKRMGAMPDTGPRAAGSTASGKLPPCLVKPDGSPP